MVSLHAMEGLTEHPEVSTYQADDVLFLYLGNVSTMKDTQEIPISTMITSDSAWACTKSVTHFHKNCDDILQARSWGRPQVAILFL